MKKKKQAKSIRERVSAFYLNKAAKVLAKSAATDKAGNHEEALVLYRKYLKYKRLYSMFSR